MADEPSKPSHRMAWIAFAGTIFGALITTSGGIAVAWINGAHRTDDPGIPAQIAAGFQFLANKLAERPSGAPPVSPSKTSASALPANEPESACSGDPGWLRAKLIEVELNGNDYNVTIEVSALAGQRLAIASIGYNSQHPTLSANNGDHSMGYVAISLPTMDSNTLLADAFYSKMPKITDSPTAVIASFYVGGINHQPPATAVDVNLPLTVARDEGSGPIMEQIFVSCLHAPVKPKPGR